MQETEKSKMNTNTSSTTEGFAQKFKPLYFQDPFTDLAFLATLSKQAFKGSEIGECYSAAAQIQERGGVLTGYKEGLKRNRFLPGS
jgi:hypothetical protein